MKLKEILFTGFYSGYFPIAPGTAGTVVAMILVLIEYLIFKQNSWIVNLILLIIFFYPSIRLSDDGAKFFNKKDPKQVVIDEIIGYWITILFFPISYKLIIVAFIAFRVFDISKPYPVKSVEKIKGGAGIVLDDCVAGIFAWIVIYLLGIIQLYTGFEILYTNDFIKTIWQYKLFL